MLYSLGYDANNDFIDCSRDRQIHSATRVSRSKKKFRCPMENEISPRKHPKASSRKNTIASLFSKALEGKTHAASKVS